MIWSALAGDDASYDTYGVNERGDGRLADAVGLLRRVRKLFAVKVDSVDLDFPATVGFSEMHFTNSTNVYSQRVHFVGSKRRRVKTSIGGVVEPDGHPGNARVVHTVGKLSDGDLALTRDVNGIPLQRNLCTRQQ